MLHNEGQPTISRTRCKAFCPALCSNRFPRSHCNARRALIDRRPGAPLPALCRVFPNASAKQKGERASFLGEAMLGMKDVGALALRRPVDRGYVVAWDLQREILAR